uniref:Glycosyltransferase family 92 protein n=1 Tax=Onchocerca volvulus TaxID=6282 RepID=A0A8R1TXE7_ONCVO
MITKAHLILYRIQTSIEEILLFAQEALSSLKWHLFMKLDLRKVPLVMNYTQNVTDDTLFIYKAFLDLRRQEPLIRILAFSQCRDINVILHYDLQCISAKDVTIEYDCPWKWVPQCKWFSFMLIFNMKDTNFSINTKEIMVTEKNRIVVIPLQPLPRKYQDILHVCVPPLYWYWNYVAFIQFIEIWRKQGATMFYIYYVSVNRHTMDILKIYEKMGIIQLIRWQMMPRSKLVDPNQWIYRFGHTLSMNDCLYSSPAKYVALVDIDEFIIPNSGTLLPFLRKMHDLNNTAGSFVFEHARVRFQGWIFFKKQPKLDFTWLKSAEFQIQEGPSKTVFMPERVQILVTHKVREFLKPYKSFRVSTDEGLLYHARSNWIFTSLNDSIYHPTEIFGKYITPLNDQYEKIMSQVSWLEQNLIPVWKIFSKKIEKCASKWRIYGCKTPYHLCWNALNNEDDWIFSHINVSSHYTLL